MLGFVFVEPDKEGEDLGEDQIFAWDDNTEPQTKLRQSRSQV